MRKSKKKSELIASGDISRYDMSDFTYRQLQRDHINFMGTFCLKFEAGFINRILINYMGYAQDDFREEFEQSIVNCFSKKSNTDYRYDDRVSISKGLVEIIQLFDFVDDDSFKKRPIINCILERFAKLRLSDREKVFFYEQYKTIREAIDRQIHLILTTSSGKEYEVQPYKFDVDDNSGSFYLVGYSRKKGTNDKFSWHSYKLSRIKKCSKKNKDNQLQNTATANAIIDKFGIAYMQHNLTLSEMTRTEVRLTERGYHQLYLKIISHQRPIPISEPKSVKIGEKTFYDLIFECSYYQIKNYFFSFGAEAQIKSPDLVKGWFINDYVKALDAYLSDADKKRLLANPMD